jgi:AmiR/NasT family two-component response regulator
MTTSVTLGGHEAIGGEPTAQVGSLADRVAELEGANENLCRALEHSRDIGVAMGVLMSSRQVSRDEAFDLLREASMRTNRKLHLLVLDVIKTGVLPR